MNNRVLKEIKKIILIGSDVYMVEATKDKIIINDGYLGITVLNYQLEKVKDIRLFDDLIIDFVFQRKTNNELLLYCFENKCLIFIDLNNYTHKIITLNGYFETNNFSRLFIWENDIILTDYNHNFYKVFVCDGRVDKVSSSLVQKKYPLFFEICEKVKNSGIATYISESYVVLLNNLKTQEIELLNFFEQKQESVRYPLKRTHDFRYKNEHFLLIHEQQIDLVQSIGQRYQIKTKAPWVFLRAKFLESDNVRFVALSRNDRHQKKRKLFIYSLE